MWPVRLRLTLSIKLAGRLDLRGAHNPLKAGSIPARAIFDLSQFAGRGRKKNGRVDCASRNPDTVRVKEIGAEGRQADTESASRRPPQDRVFLPLQLGGGESLNHLMWSRLSPHIRQGAKRWKRKQRAANESRDDARLSNARPQPTYNAASAHSARRDDLYSLAQMSQTLHRERYGRRRAVFKLEDGRGGQNSNRIILKDSAASDF